jgi:4-alpha-glucanotransferase
MSRSSGIFLHITSLPSKYGIGDLGHDARRWINTIADAGQSIWQICPVGPVGYGFSPYMTLSAFAGNPMIISPELLKDWGYLSESDLVSFPSFSTEKVEFDRVSVEKERLLKTAYKNFSPNEEYSKFCKNESYWLDDFVVFTSLSNHFKTTQWTKWSKKYREYDKKELALWLKENEKEIDYVKFVQFILQSQWFDLKSHAHSRGVKIFGDVPYYVAYESSDVWANQNLFELDKKGKALRVGGVPPDYFSEDGQLWGNPLYRWDDMKKDGYDWWIKRFRRSFYYNDLVRIDHFRAFEAFWAIDGDSKTAKVGEWIKGPGHDLFVAVRKALGDVEVIAEDLGIITDEVVALRIGENMPGMKILQFAFDENSENWYLPFNCEQNSVMYTGTHDNDTTQGWVDSLDENQIKPVLTYFDCSKEKLNEKMCRAVIGSVSDMAIIPLQDILGLDSSARFNVPGTVSDNWSWRFDWGMIKQDKFNKLKEWTTIFGRLNK